MRKSVSKNKDRREDPSEHNARNLERLHVHDYSSKRKSHAWTEKEMKQFLVLTEKYVDHELAKKLKRSLASIQGMRRRLKLAGELGKGNKSVTAKLFFENSESLLRKQLASKKRK